MKYFILLTSALLFFNVTYAQVNPDIILDEQTAHNNINSIENKLEEISSENNALRLRLADVSDSCRTQGREMVRLRQNDINLRQQILKLEALYCSQVDSIKVLQASFANNSTAVELKISEVSTTANYNNATLSKNINDRTLWGAIVVVLCLMLSSILAIVLHKRGQSEITSLKVATDKLNEKIMIKLSSEMDEIKKLSSAMSTYNQTLSSSPTCDHSLIKIIADRITFMEMTLYKMDNSIRGHKQLSKSIKQMKDNLLANGYELVEMLGKPYHEGMKVVANFTEDETLKENEQIITGIIKPQINYNGVMIQSAQITVSQN